MPEAINDLGNVIIQKRLCIFLGILTFGSFSQDIEESRWQFLITGGIDFGMPLTVFQVNIVLNCDLTFNIKTIISESC